MYPEFLLGTLYFGHGPLNPGKYCCSSHCKLLEEFLEEDDEDEDGDDDEDRVFCDGEGEDDCDRGSDGELDDDLELAWFQHWQPSNL